MAEIAFLEAVGSYLAGASLTPAPALLGVAEPRQAAELPAVVLSLDGCARERAGVGGRRSNERKQGALPRSAVIDLAAPHPPDDPSFSLLDAPRTHLILPHGGLVRADGSSGALTGADLSVSLQSGGPPVALSVVTGAPAAGQVQASSLEGVLTFGTALSASGSVRVDYNLGSWEQELIRLRGVLRIEVCAVAAADARALSEQVATRLLDDAARSAIRRLYAMQLTSLSSVAVTVGDPLQVSRRSALFAFQYEHEINTPESSGRVIRSIPVESRFFPD